MYVPNHRVHYSTNVNLRYLCQIICFFYPIFYFIARSSWSTFEWQSLVAMLVSFLMYSMFFMPLKLYIFDVESVDKAVTEVLFIRCGINYIELLINFTIDFNNRSTIGFHCRQILNWSHIYMITFLCMYNNLIIWGILFLASQQNNWSLLKLFIGRFDRLYWD